MSQWVNAWTSSSPRPPSQSQPLFRIRKDCLFRSGTARLGILITGIWLGFPALFILCLRCCCCVCPVYKEVRGRGRRLRVRRLLCVCNVVVERRQWSRRRRRRAPNPCLGRGRQLRRPGGDRQDPPQLQVQSDDGGQREEGTGAAGTGTGREHDHHGLLDAGDDGVRASQKSEGAIEKTTHSLNHENGVTPLLWLQESSELREIPVVIMSSENVPNRINRCLAEGAEDFLLKPVRPSDVSRLCSRIR